MNNSKRGLLAIIILAVILIGIIGTGSIKDKIANKKNTEEYIQSLSADDEAGKESPDKQEEAESTTKVEGLPDKLRAKQEVKVLMLGDNIAMSTGKSSENGKWSDGIKNALEKDYGSKVTLDLVAQKDATTKTGLDQINSVKFTDYDLVILCYGYNDNKNSLKVDDVRSNYKAIVEKIRKANSNAMIVSVLESPLEVNNPYRAAINEIATTKSLVIADMKNAFISSGVKESVLAVNGMPNDRGYQIYTQTLENKLKQVIG